MYTDKADITGKNVLKCLEGAKLYAIAGLAANCSAFLEKNVNAVNVCTIHEQAIYYKMKDLQTKCFEFMVENASEIFKHDSFLKISKSTLVRLLKSDDLAEDEENVFTAALSWAEAQCSSNKVHVTPDNKRKCLGEALDEIRFPIMSIGNFAKLVTPAGVLTSDEQIMLYQYLASNGTAPLNKFVARNRFGNAVTINMKKYEKKKGYTNAFGYFLSITMGQILGYDRPDTVKLKAVTGTFAAEVKRVSSELDRRNIDFKLHGNKIIFHSPLLISNEISIVFETSERQGKHRPEGESSYNVNCSANVNGKSVSISLIPEGLTSVTFAK